MFKSVRVIYLPIETELNMSEPVEKSVVIEKFKTHTSDTGSPQVQVALLTGRILHLTEHFKLHPKDNHSRMGLYTAVNRRRKLLSYLKRKDLAGYQKLIQELSLRK